MNKNTLFGLIIVFFFCTDSISLRLVCRVLNKQKVKSMMKRIFLSIVVICMYCLTVASRQADDSIEKKIKVYPNPVDRTTLVTIDIPDDRNETTVVLYNTVGKVIQTFKSSNNKIAFNAPDVSGIYLLRFVENQKVIAVEKIVVKE